MPDVQRADTLNWRIGTAGSGLPVKLLTTLTMLTSFRSSGQMKFWPLMSIRW